MSSGADAELVRWLADRARIRDVIVQYARGVDRADAALIRSCFWDDAVDDHGFAVLGPDELTAAAIAMTALFESTMHFMGSSLIEIDGDAARSETYCVAHHRLAISDGGEFDRVVGYRIIDQLARRHDAWRFTSRVHVFEWARIDEVAETWRDTLGGRAELAPVLPHWPIPVGAHRGRRDRSDLAYGPVTNDLEELIS